MTPAPRVNAQTHTQDRLPVECRAKACGSFDSKAAVVPQ